VKAQKKCEGQKTKVLKHRKQNKRTTTFDNTQAVENRPLAQSYDGV